MQLLAEAVASCIHYSTEKVVTEIVTSLAAVTTKQSCICEA
jgi:hypothetical protein